MSFTRFYDDPARIRKQAEDSTFLERYQLNTPGNGTEMPLQMDPQIRLQTWGANLHTNAIHLESDFRGLTRRLNRDHIDRNDFAQHLSDSTPYNYSKAAPFIDESRASHPAWMYRDCEQTRWEYPWINPQDNTECPFNWNIQTRILEKDHFVPRYPNVSSVERTDFYFSK